MLKLEIPDNIVDQMIAQAAAQAPIEACGILAGTDGTVVKLYEMTNADASADHFMMTPEEQFAVVKEMRSDGVQMLAVYHSHPETPARPSAEDIRLALTPGVVYVILSLQDSDNPVVKGFNIEAGDVAEVPVSVTKGLK